MQIQPVKVQNGQPGAVARDHVAVQGGPTRVGGRAVEVSKSGGLQLTQAGHNLLLKHKVSIPAGTRLPQNIVRLMEDLSDKNGKLSPANARTLSALQHARPVRDHHDRVK